MEYIVAENQYPAQTAADREEMFFKSRGLAKGADDEYREWMRAFCERKYNSEFSREMTRSVRKYLEDFKKEGDRI